MAVILTCIWASTFSASYQICETERVNSSSQEKKTDFRKEIALFFVCEGVTLDDNVDLLTAIATIIMAIFTGTLWLVTGRAVSLARDEFIASHRPKLRLRLLRIESLDIGKAIAIHFDLANIGDTAAKIADIDITIRIRDIRAGIPPKIQDFIWAGKILDHRVIAAGESGTIDFISPVLFERTWGIPTKGWAAGRLAIIGLVTYVDDRLIKRRTAFYRYCTDDVNRFRFADFGEEATKRDREYED